MGRSKEGRIPVPQGEEFGYLTVQGEAPDKIEPDGSCTRMITVKCICGVVKPVRYNSLVNGQVRSCGCKKIQLFLERVIGDYTPTPIKTLPERAEAKNKIYVIGRLKAISDMEKDIISGARPLKDLRTMFIETRKFLGEDTNLIE